MGCPKERASICLSTLAQASGSAPLDRAAALGMIATLDMTTRDGHDDQVRT
jgi:hypothetical protein